MTPWVRHSPSPFYGTVPGARTRRNDALEAATPATDAAKRAPAPGPLCAEWQPEAHNCSSGGWAGCGGGGGGGGTAGAAAVPRRRRRRPRTCSRALPCPWTSSWRRRARGGTVQLQPRVSLRHRDLKQAWLALVPPWARPKTARFSRLHARAALRALSEADRPGWRPAAAAGSPGRVLMCVAASGGGESAVGPGPRWRPPGPTKRLRGSLCNTDGQL